MGLPSRVRLVEVGPRDGLQNEQAMVPTDVKVALIDLLTDAGFPAIEATSFVSPKWVPQMADAADVMARIRRKPGVRYPVLTPNMKGFEAALAAKADEVAVFVAASETFSRKNINCSIDESLERARPIFDAAAAAGVRVRGYISCVLGCPYEGKVDPRTRSPDCRQAARNGCVRSFAGRHHRHRHRGRNQGVAGRMRRTGADRARWQDTSTTPTDRRWPTCTRRSNRASRTFDCSVAGLGGCPYAKGATGNVASEDVLYLLQGLGIETGVDMTRLRRAGQYISDFLQRPPVSRVARALNAKSPLAA